MCQRPAAPTDAGWSVSASFFDYDRDGWLDLFVGHYLNYSVEANLRCYSVSGSADYCPPHVYRAQPSKLFHNNRDGTFTDVTVAAGMSREFGPALGVSAADYNGDGWIDLYVANDSEPNQLWINQRNGTFKNTALLAGVALSPEGTVKASMGIDAGDFDNDGDEDVFITELAGQGDDLYVNDGSGAFEDRSARAGIRLASLPYTGFGAAWFDFDNDSWLDLLAVNGAVTQNLGAQSREANVSRSSSGNSCSATSATAGSRTSRRRRARRCRRPRSAAGPRLATSTTTATPTSSSATTAARCGCSSTISAAASTGWGSGWLAARRRAPKAVTCSARVSR